MSTFQRWPTGVAATVSRVGADRIVLAAYFATSLWFLSATSLAPHELWSKFAVAAYAVAFVVTFVPAARKWAFVVALGGALAVPLVWMAAKGVAQPEVTVLVDGAKSMLEKGTPYVPAPSDLSLVRPYSPTLYVFGLPRALGLGGLPGDPRIWIAIMAVGGWWISRATRDGAGSETVGRVGLAVLALPLFTLNLSVSAIDIPMTVLLCAALVASARGSQLWLTLLAAAALSMKPTALAFVAIAFVTLLRKGLRLGALRFLLGVGLLAALVTLPWVAVDPRAFVQNTVLFPAGLYSVASPAASPFPGVLLAELGNPGRILAIVLMVLALVGSVAYTSAAATTWSQATRQRRRGCTQPRLPTRSIEPCGLLRAPYRALACGQPFRAG